MNNPVTVKGASVGFDQAVREIVAWRAAPCSLWMILGAESDRDGFALRPAPWEGPGEYQAVEWTDRRTTLVRVPVAGISLQEAAQRAAAKGAPRNIEGEQL